MRIRHSVHGLLMLDKPTKQWYAWCPELDVATQGSHPDNAAAMLEEACRMVLEDAVNYIHESWVEPELAIDCRAKRVVHPLRLGVDACKDENWVLYQELRNAAHSNADGTRSLDFLDLNELRDGLDPNILIDGSYEINSRSGVNRVEIRFGEWGEVPVQEYTVQYMQAHHRKTSVSVRMSVIKSGSDPMSIVEEQVEYLKKDAVGGLKVTKK